MVRRVNDATAFVAGLYRLSRAGTNHWRRADAVARYANVPLRYLEQILADCDTAGLLDRGAEDPMLVVLTPAGRAAARDRAYRTSRLSSL